MTVTTTDNYGTMTDAWAHRALLQRPKPRNVHSILCTPFDLPQKSSRSLTMRRQENLNSDPVVLPKDGDPAPEQLQKFDINVEVQEFGKVVLLGRDVLLLEESDTAQETADNLSQCMHTMLDKVCRDVWDASTPQISCLNGVNGNAITELSQQDVDRAIAYLDDNDTEKMTPIIEGSSRFGTGPVEASFWVTSHTNLKPDIRALNSFLSTAEYGSQDMVLQAEFGATDEARWLTSTLVKKSSDSPPIYNNTFIGAYAVGSVSVDDVSTEIIIKRLGQHDYLNRFQSMGFTAWYNAVVLDDAHIATLLSTKA